MRLHTKHRFAAANRLRAFLPLLGLLLSASPADGQAIPLRDLVIDGGAVPVRLVGYGIVTGLSGTGDATLSGRNAAHTVQSVANLLRRFDVSVPPHLLRTRNVAAVLVTAEVSPYLRPGGRFDVQISSVGDARSLNGGVLWITPLVSDAGGEVFATAQGPLLLSEPATAFRSRLGRGEASGRVPAGGVLESDLPRPEPGAAGRLLLRDPDITTATRIASVVDSAIGPNTARVEDPGAVALTLPDTARATLLARIRELRIEPDRPARLVVDTRQGTIVLGGELPLAPGVVSVGGVTISISNLPADTTQTPAGGTLRMRAGSTAQDLADILQSIGAPAVLIAQIFQALHQSGSVSAEVVTR